MYLTKHINKGNIYKVLAALSYFQHKNIFSKVFGKYLDDETVKPHGISHIYEMRESPSKKGTIYLLTQPNIKDRESMSFSIFYILILFCKLFIRSIKFKTFNIVSST